MKKYFHGQKFFFKLSGPLAMKFFVANTFSDRVLVTKRISSLIVLGDEKLNIYDENFLH